MIEPTILTFDGVGKSYGAIRALDSLTLRVRRDEIVALLGPNGAGKTTALEIALGLRGTDSGSATPSAAAVRVRARLESPLRTHERR